MRSWHKNNVRIGFLVVKLLLKEVSHKFLAGLVQKLDFPRFRRRPFWKNVNIWKCSRDVTWHPPESWRAIPRLQETVEKKTLTDKTTFTILGPGLSLAYTAISVCSISAVWGQVFVSHTGQRCKTAAGSVNPSKASKGVGLSWKCVRIIYKEYIKSLSLYLKKKFYWQTLVLSRVQKSEIE